MCCKRLDNRELFYLCQGNPYVADFKYFLSKYVSRNSRSSFQPIVTKSGSLCKKGTVVDLNFEMFLLVLVIQETHLKLEDVTYFPLVPCLEGGVYLIVFSALALNKT